jgi:hypothetical protein
MQVQLLQLNIPQQIFTLFYAITWGTAANSQPRWKAFAWGAIRDDAPSRYRALLSVCLLNVLPLIYFVLVLDWLNFEALWNTIVWWKIFGQHGAVICPFWFLSDMVGCYRTMAEAILRDVAG